MAATLPSHSVPNVFTLIMSYPDEDPGLPWGPRAWVLRPRVCDISLTLLFNEKISIKCAYERKEMDSNT